jgi:hypothetical protein
LIVGIRDDQLWRLRHNVSTFEEYCEERWELNHTRPFQLINAAAFAEKVHNCVLKVPSRESHIRPLLARLEADEDRIAVWRDVLATTNGAGRGRRTHARSQRAAGQAEGAEAGKGQARSHGGPGEGEGP